MTTNRTHKPAYLAKGEVALISKALRFFIHEQQVLIDQAHRQYVRERAGQKELGRAIFEDMKAHHEAQINAAQALHERIRTNQVYKETE